MSDVSSSHHRLFYGWVVVAAACGITFFGFGSSYTFSAFLTSLQHDFGASRGSVSLVFSLSAFLYYNFGVVSGALASRWGARRLAVMGMLFLGIGLILASRAQSLWEVYVGYGIGVGLGIGCSYVPAIGTVQRWFVRNRGLASGFAVSGTGLGTLVMPLLASWLIKTVGWRDAYLLLGCLAATLGTGLSLLLVDDPRQRGLAPDGDPIQTNASIPATTGTSVRQAIQSIPFIGLYIACLISSLGIFVPFVHLVPYALDHHVNPSLAVLLIGVIGAGSTSGRFFLGGFADRMGRESFLIVMLVGIAVSLALWALVSSFWMLAIFAFLFGSFYGGWFAIIPAVVMDYVGAQNVRAIIGILYTSLGIGALLGPSMAGFAFDISHSYLLPILAGVGANIIAAGIVMLSTQIVSRKIFSKNLSATSLDQ